MAHPLDNPVHASLASHHATLAHGDGGALRYAPDVAPFIGIATADVLAAAVERLVARDELVCFVGVAPRLGANWRIEHDAPIAQMVRDAPPLEIIDGPPVVGLASAAHVADMLALTALVYPHYFRPRTIAMGSYVGIYENGRLAAMAGERMHFRGHREISAVCTHPDFTGRGHARRLVTLLTGRILARGERPFLHFSHDNTRAKALYERMGFRFRADVPLLVATRL